MIWGGSDYIAGGYFGSVWGGGVGVAAPPALSPVSQGGGTYIYRFPAAPPVPVLPYQFWAYESEVSLGRLRVGSRVRFIPAGRAYLCESHLALYSPLISGLPASGVVVSALAVLPGFLPSASESQYVKGGVNAECCVCAALVMPEFGGEASMLTAVIGSTGLRLAIVSECRHTVNRAIEEEDEIISLL